MTYSVALEYQNTPYIDQPKIKETIEQALINTDGNAQVVALDNKMLVEVSHQRSVYLSRKPVMLAALACLVFPPLVLLVFGFALKIFIFGDKNITKVTLSQKPERMGNYQKLCEWKIENLQPKCQTDATTNSVDFFPQRSFVATSPESIKLPHRSS